MSGLPKNKFLLGLIVVIFLAAFLLWLVSSYVYIQNGQLTFGHIVARVGDQVLTDDDLASYSKIFNGRRHCTDQNSAAGTNSEITADLIKATRVEQKASSKGITVSAEEVETEKESQALNAGGIVKLMAKCGWDDRTFTSSVKLQLLSKKLGS